MVKALILAVFLLLAGCAQAGQGRVTVGMILPLTGTFAFYGTEQQRGADIALEEAGGQLQVVFEDSAGENARAVSAFQKLVNVDDAKIFVTSTSWVSNAVYPQAADAGVFQVIIASAAFKRTRNDNAVRFTVDVKEEVPYLLEYIKNFDRIAIVHLNNDFGNVWANALSQNLNDKVVAVESYGITDNDVNLQLTKIRSAKPEVLVLISTGRDGALIARKARELGIIAQLASTRAVESPDLLKEPAAEGIIYSYPAFDAGHSFVSLYREKYGTEPTVSAAEAYDVIVSVAKAVQECGNGVDCIHQWYLNREYTGVLGKVRFDEKGDAHYPFMLKQVKGNSFLPYEK